MEANPFGSCLLRLDAACSLLRLDAACSLLIPCAFKSAAAPLRGATVGQRQKRKVACTLQLPQKTEALLGFFWVCRRYGSWMW